MQNEDILKQKIKKLEFALEESLSREFELSEENIRLKERIAILERKVDKFNDVAEILRIQEYNRQY